MRLLTKKKRKSSRQGQVVTKRIGGDTVRRHTGAESIRAFPRDSFSKRLQYFFGHPASNRVRKYSRYPIKPRLQRSRVTLGSSSVWIIRIVAVFATVECLFQFLLSNSLPNESLRASTLTTNTEKSEQVDRLSSAVSSVVNETSNQMTHNRHLKVPQKEAFPPLDPVQVFEEWKSYHSVHSLRRLPSLEGRNFILANFGCPMQLGSQSTDFVDSLLIAIATNRTLLFKYGGIAGWVRKGQNSKENCCKILRRADWIPLYEEFENQLPDVYRIERETFNDRDQNWTFHHRVNSGQPAHSDISSHTLVEIPRLWTLAPSIGAWGGLSDLRNKYASAYISDMFNLAQPLRIQKRIRKLYREDIYFLYGMLFWRSFSLTEELVQSVHGSAVPTNSSLFSIAVHSRHSSSNEDGSNVNKEMTCIHQLIDNYSDGKPCQTYIMSDRPLTVDTLSARVRAETNCTVVHVLDYSGFVSGDGNVEHGEFAGAGFLQDLVVVGVARSGFVRERRSSTSFVASYIEYHRRMQQWSTSGARQSERLLECCSWGIEPRPLIFWSHFCKNK